MLYNEKGIGYSNSKIEYNINIVTRTLLSHKINTLYYIYSIFN